MGVMEMAGLGFGLLGERREAGTGSGGFGG